MAAERLVVLDPAAIANPVDDGQVVVASLRRHEHRDRTADHFVGGVSEHSLRGAVPAQDASREVLRDDRVIAGIDDRGQQAAVRVAGLALGDVHSEARHADGYALLENRVPQAPDPDLAAAGRQNAKLDVVVLPVAKRARDRRPHLRDVVGMDQLLEGLELSLEGASWDSVDLLEVV